MIKRKILVGTASLAFAFTLAACSDSAEETAIPEEEVVDDNQEEMEMEMDDSTEDEMEMEEGMDHSGSGEVPEGLMAAENPTFEVGSQVIVEADHMDGMQGAEATVSGAFDTTVYSISYTPENGELVEGHKWVVHEELENPGDEPLESGEEAIVTAAHLTGMAGTPITIDTAEETTVYMIDYTTPTGEEVVNHMWVTEDELVAAE
ncbi:YdhK family protein [Planococcus lenghuensis]|uniref:DUF1541 domain-containing protein n=1 Tax=Planococcus lenghuensis TaxID=2213202 RepID=A0A1Q2L4D7_9BACL|nr:YdhK family protein [Planococcus lenghuensis]AQQ55299.1 hypothetical protein B0X71_19165 [Planococcus lenghuensis]